MASSAILRKLCRASGVAADIDIARIPISEAAKTVIAANSGALESVLTGGDDYEIVCTVPAAKAGQLPYRGQGSRRGGQ